MRHFMIKLYMTGKVYGTRWTLRPLSAKVSIHCQMVLIYDYLEFDMDKKPFKVNAKCNTPLQAQGQKYVFETCSI